MGPNYFCVLNTTYLLWQKNHSNQEYARYKLWCLNHQFNGKKVVHSISLWLLYREWIWMFWMPNWGCKTRDNWKNPRCGGGSSEIESAQDQGSHRQIVIEGTQLSEFRPKRHLSAQQQLFFGTKTSLKPRISSIYTLSSQSLISMVNKWCTQYHCKCLTTSEA